MTGAARRMPAKLQRACARYDSQDLAQAEFLASGGPRMDRRGVDPDGDGFACGWDPAPFRTTRIADGAAPAAAKAPLGN